MTPADNADAAVGSPSVDAAVSSSRTSDLGMPETMTYPDIEAFEQDVLPILTRGCGVGCHQGSVNLDNNDLGAGNHFEFDPEDIEKSI